ncbi:MAG: hypothetical protein AAB316_15395, partial [Bacteroidota bacterium]
SRWDLGEWSLEAMEAFTRLVNGSTESAIVWGKDFQTGELVKIYRSFFSYNSLQQLAEISYQSPCYFMPDEWFSGSKYTFSYDAAGNETEALVAYFQQNSESWYLANRLVKTYDEQGNLLSESFQSQGFGENFVWENSNRFTQKLNSQGQIAQVKGFNWNFSLSDWWLTWQNDFAYNELGLRVEEEFGYFDYCTASIVPSSKLTNTYNDFGQLAEQTYSIWTGTIWSPLGKALAQYDSTGMLAELIYQYFDLSEWVNNRRQEYSYDSTGQVAEIKIYQWYFVEWYLRNRVVFSYNQEGLLTYQTYQHLSPDGWKNLNRWLFDYFPDGKMSSETYEFFQELTWLKIFQAHYS